MEYGLRFDITPNLSIFPTKEHLPVFSISLRLGRKSRSTILAGITCLWDRYAINIIIKNKHNKPYKRKLYLNRVEYSTSLEPNCTTHDVKVPFCMLEFYIINIISYLLHNHNGEGELVIV